MKSILCFVAAMGLACFCTAANADWPPQLKGAVNGTVTFSSPELLEIPAEVAEAAKQPDAAKFEVAKNPPTVELALHADLGPNAAERRLWSSWGDICTASDG